MFIGHYAVGLAAKKAAPKVSLGTLVAAAIGLDLLWSLFLLLGLESFRISPGITRLVPIDFNDYPLSHSLVMALCWAVLAVLVYLMAGNRDERAAWVIGAVVISNWVLDFLVHRPDLPILPAEPNWGMNHKYGLGLWNHPAAAVLLEAAFFVAGFWIYLISTKARDGAGKVSLWAFGVVLAGLYAAVLLSPPPANAGLVPLAVIFQLLFVAWAYWIDDHRKMTAR